MEPLYKGFQDVINFYINYGYNQNSSEEEFAAREALGIVHNHSCWLNPNQSLFSRRTRRLCKKFCKKNNIPKERFYKKDYDCDECPNLLTYYKEGNNFLFALGNNYLYEKQGLIKK